MTDQQRLILMALYFGFVGATLFKVVEHKFALRTPSGPSFAQHWQLQGYVQALELRLKHLEVDLGIPASRLPSA